MNQIDLSRTDLNLLVLFEVVLEERHVGRAAARLNLSPSAISHGLNRLRRLLNDPLFIRHPKGLNPTERALALAIPVAEILDGARAIVATADPFEPATSRRRFVIGAVEAIGSVALPDVLAVLAKEAPDVSIAVRSIFPDDVPARLDSHAVDVALAPLLPFPARFVTRDLYVEEFVVAARKGHPFLANPSIEAFCAETHLLVAQATDRGFVDDALEAQGLERRIGLSVPSFMWALAIVGDTDLIAALPRSLVDRHGLKAGVASVNAPIKLRSDMIGIVTPAAALSDPGIVWLIDLIAKVTHP